MSAVPLLTIGKTAITLGDVGLVLGAASSFAAAQAQAGAAAQEAAIARRQAAQQERELRRKNRKILGRQRALFAKSGVRPEGTPLLVQEETAAEGELDALNIRHSGDLRSARLLNEARAARLRGRDALLKGVFGIGRTILTGTPSLAPRGQAPTVSQGASRSPFAPNLILV